MKTILIVAVGMLILFAAAVVLLRIVRRAPSKLFRARRLQTENELEFFGRMCRALPDRVVLAQVSMAAIVEPAVPKNSRQWIAAFNQVAAKRLDYVVGDREGNIEAVIELDDRTHHSGRDKRRDAILTAAGYRVIRWESRAKPSEAEIAATLGLLPSLAGPGAPGGR